MKQQILWRRQVSAGCYSADERASARGCTRLRRVASRPPSSPPAGSSSGSTTVYTPTSSSLPSQAPPPCPSHHSFASVVVRTSCMGPAKRAIGCSALDRTAIVLQPLTANDGLPLPRTLTSFWTAVYSNTPPALPFPTLSPPVVLSELLRALASFPFRRAPRLSPLSVARLRLRHVLQRPASIHSPPGSAAVA